MSNSYENNKLKFAKENTRYELEEYLNGIRICNYITKEQESEILNDFDKWSKTAKYNDVYYYDSLAFIVKER